MTSRSCLREYQDCATESRQRLALKFENKSLDLFSICWSLHYSLYIHLFWLIDIFSVKRLYNYSRKWKKYLSSVSYENDLWCEIPFNSVHWSGNALWPLTTQICHSSELIASLKCPFQPTAFSQSPDCSERLSFCHTSTVLKSVSVIWHWQYVILKWS